MRVAVVAETFLPAVNGVVTAVLRLVDHLAVRGHDPVVVAPSGVGYESRCGAQVEVVTVPTMRLPRYRQLAPARPAGDLTEVLRRLAPDVVHLASPAVLGLAAARAARALGVPSVAVFQTDLAAHAPRYRLPGGAAAAWRYLRTVHGTADLTLAPSSATAAVLARQGIGPIALWPRGVDLDQLAPCHRDEALRQQLGARNWPRSSPRWTCSCTRARTRRSARRCRRRWPPASLPSSPPQVDRWTWCGTVPA
jgi:phosphatidylinositol alpha 1,6-mannosyltransferase